MVNIFAYIELAVSLISVVPTFIAMFQAKQKITGAAVQADIQPALISLQAILPKFQPDPVIVLDFCSAFADTFNKYVVA
jgi:hypothetical protein